MYKFKRILLSTMALLLCLANLVTPAFALTVQNAVSGNVAIPSTIGGGEGDNRSTYNATLIAGYRFSCWRTDDAKQNGYKLGHSINILLNTERADFAGNFGQTGRQAPRILGVFDDYHNIYDMTDKVSVGITEISTDEQAKQLGQTKVHHSTKLEYVTLHYQGNTAGTTLNGKGPSITLTQPLYTAIEYDSGNTNYNSKYGSTADAINPDEPESYIKILSGFIAKDNNNSLFVNGGTGDLYTYIYGARTNSNGDIIKDCADGEGIYTISDVDHDKSRFTSNPSDIINTGDETSWTNLNAALIATLCGLTPMYGQQAYAVNEFGAHDYIIVEPIYYVYYYYQRFLVTATDCGLLQADSQVKYRKKSNGQVYDDCWDTSYGNLKHDKYAWGPLSDSFPARLCAHVFSTEKFLGLDGVVNAQAGTELSRLWKTNPKNPSQGSEKHAFVVKKSGYKIYSDELDRILGKDRVNTRTNAIAYSTYKSNSDVPYTIFAGNNSWWYNGNRYRSGATVTPRTVCESMMGAGTWTAFDNNTARLAVVYHADENSPGHFEQYPMSTSAFTLATYDILGNVYTNYIPGNTWSTKNKNGANTTFAAGGKVSHDGHKDMAAYFSSLGAQYEGQCLTLHLYAAWHRGPVVFTALNRDEVVPVTSLAKIDNLKGMRLCQQSSTGTTNIYPLEQRSLGTWTPVDENLTKEEAIGAWIEYTYGDDKWIKYMPTDSTWTWQAGTEHLIVDFYDYTIKAPGCTIQATQKIPSDDTLPSIITTQELSLQLACGEAIQYTVTSQSATPIQKGNAIIIQKDNGVLTGKEVPHTIAIDNQLLFYSNKIDSNNQNDAIAQEDSRISTKNVREFHLAQAALLIIKPHLDNTPQIPFESKKGQYYYVSVTANNTTTTYTNNPNDKRFVHIDDANGVVNHTILPNTEYTIKAIIAGCEYDANAMADVTKVAVKGTAYDIEIPVKYYTTSITIRTDGESNHSGISATIWCFDKAHKDDEETNAYHEAVAEYPASNPHTDYDCASKGVSTTTMVALTGARLRIGYNQSSQWYKAAGGTLATEIEVKDDPQSYDYTFAPYHYVYVYKDNVSVNPSTIYGNNIPEVENIAADDNGLIFVGWKMPASTLKSLSLYNAISVSDNNSNKVQDTFKFEQLDLYNRSQTIYLYYYTASTNADEGYQSTSIFSGSTDLGARTLILDRADIVSAYNMCCDGGWQQTMQTQYNETEYKAAATLKDGTGDDFAALQYVGSVYFPSLEQGVRKNTYRWNSADKSALIQDGNESNLAITFKQINRVSSFTWTSGKQAEVLFTFYINDVPYERLGATIDDMVYLKSATTQTYFPLTLSVDAENNVIATGSVSVRAKNEATKFVYTLVLGDQDTGVEYEIQTKPASTPQTYKVDFYTIQTAAGTGIDSTSIAPPEAFNDDGWNGTLPYVDEVGAVRSTVLVVFPKSIPVPENATSASSSVTIDCIPSENYTFDYWYTYEPNSGMKGITYSDGNVSKSQKQKDTVIKMHLIDRPTTVVASARPANSSDTPGSTPGDSDDPDPDPDPGDGSLPTPEPQPVQPPIPVVIVPNTLDYKIVVRTFLDGHLTTPWDNMWVKVRINGDAHLCKVNFGYAVWQDTIFPVKEDPYANKTATVSVAPSQAFTGKTAYTTTVDLQPGTVYVDVYYYTQTIRTHVNGVGIAPWDNVTSQYSQTYNNQTVSATTSLGEYGAASVVMMQGTLFSVSGQPTINSTDYKLVVSDHKVIGAHTHVIPYFTVTVNTVCVTKNSSIDCHSVLFNGDKITANDKITVMAGEYDISYATACSTPNAGHNKHTLINAIKGENAVFKVEYKPSSDKEYPFPTITYTGDKRKSLSTLNVNSNGVGTIDVCDETNITLEYSEVDEEDWISVTLYSIPTAVCPSCHKETTAATANVAKTCEQCGVELLLIMDMSQGFVDNVKPSLHGVTLKYDKAGNIGLAAVVNNAVRLHQDRKVYLTININGNISSETHEVYYATCRTADDLKDVLANPANNLRECGVVQATLNSSGKYTAALPYSEDTYYLYIDGVKQADEHSVNNRYEAHYNFVKWTKHGETAAINPTVAIALGQSYAYDAHAKVTVVSGENDIADKNDTVDFRDIKIYVQTDYENKTPYDDFGIKLNNQECIFPSGENNITVRVDGSTALAVFAPASDIANSAYFELAHITENTNIITLEYYTISTESNGALIPSINGVMTKIVLFGHYLVDGEMYTTDQSVQINVSGEQATSRFRTTRYHFANIQSVVTGFKWVAKEHPYITHADPNTKVVFTKKAVQNDGYYYISVTDNNFGDPDYEDGASYICKITRDAVVNAKNTDAHYIYLYAGVPVDIIFDTTDNSISVFASEGATITQNSNTTILYNGYYNIPDGKHIDAISGVITRVDNNTIQINATYAITDNNTQSVAFKNWNETDMYKNLSSATATGFTGNLATVTLYPTDKLLTVDADKTKHFKPIPQDNDTPETEGQQQGEIQFIIDTNNTVEITVQAVVSGTQQLPFDGANVSIQYGYENQTVRFDTEGVAKFYVPVGETYSFNGASINQFTPHNLTFSGFSTHPDIVTFENNSFQATENATYYVLYFKVNVEAREDVQNVTVHSADCQCGRVTDSGLCITHNTHASAIFQYGAQAGHSATPQSKYNEIKVVVRVNDRPTTNFKVRLESADGKQIYSDDANAPKNTFLFTNISSETTYNVQVLSSTGIWLNTTRSVSLDKMSGNIIWECAIAPKVHDGMFTVLQDTTCYAEVQSVAPDVVELYYYTLTLDGDEGIASTSQMAGNNMHQLEGNLYLTGTEVSIDAVVKNINDTQETRRIGVSINIDDLQLDSKFSDLCTVVLAKDNSLYPTKYDAQTQKFVSEDALPMGKYIVTVEIAGYTLLVNQFEVEYVFAPAAYEWRTWIEGHTPACGYNQSCLGSIKAPTEKRNTVIINHETRLVATTTKAEIDSVVTGDAINLINVRLDGDNGIQSIVFAGKEYTLSNDGYFAHVLVPAGYSTQLSANVKAPHFVDDSVLYGSLSVEILLDDNKWSGSAIEKIYLQNENNQTFDMYYNEDTGLFQTISEELPSNQTYAVMVCILSTDSPYNVGTIHPRTERKYSFVNWTEGEHYCVFHDAEHDCGVCTDTISDVFNDAAQDFTAGNQFVNLKATTTYEDNINDYDNKVRFCTLQVDADEGVESVTINGEEHKVETLVDGLAQLPYVIVPANTDVKLNVTVRNDAQNHPDAKTHVTFTLQLSDDDAPNGDYVMWLRNLENDESYQLNYTPLNNGASTYTTYTPVPAGTYAIFDELNNKSHGYVTITSERQYVWNEWTNSDNYVCRHCEEEHDVMMGVDSLQINNVEKTSAIAVCEHFTYVVARTIITDTFKFEWKEIPDNNLTYETYSISQLLDDEPFSDAPFELYWNNDKEYMMVFPSKQSVRYNGTVYTKEYSYLGVAVNGQKWYLRFDNNTVYIDIPAGAITDKIDVRAHLSVDTLEELQTRVDNFDYDWFSFDAVYDTLTSDNKHITIPFHSLTLNFYLNDEKWTSITPEIADQLLDDDCGDMLVDTGTMTVIGLSADNPFSDSWNRYAATIRSTSLTQKAGCWFVSQFNAKHVYDFKYYTVQVDHFGGFKSITAAQYYDIGAGPVNTGNVEIVGSQPYYNMYALSLDPSKVNFETCINDQDKRVHIAFNAEASYQFIGWNESNASDFTNHKWDGVPESTGPQYTINLNELTAPVYLTAHAKTKYIERHYLATQTDVLGATLGYDFSAGYNDDNQQQFWFKAYEQKKIVEVNRYASNSESPTVSIPAPAYTHFYGYKTIINSENGRIDANGVVSTDLVIRADGTSYVDFYFRKNGTVNGRDEDTTPDTPELPDERVTITYVMNGGQYNGSSENYSETHTKGTNIALIEPTPPKGLKFVGWFLINGTEHIPFSGGIGTSGNNHLLLRDTTVYAAYMIPLDLGITANDIYGSIKHDNAFTTSATIINHGPWSVIPDTGINATLTIRKGNTTVHTQNVAVVVPGAESLDTPATQLVWAVVPAGTLEQGVTYTIEWTISTHATYNPSDNGSNNDSSKLNSFTPGAMTGTKPLTRPGYESAPPKAYNPNTSVPGSYNTAFHWEYWTYEDHAFERNTSGNSFLDITILLKPENSSGLRTYTSQNPYGFHDYTTRSGYGLSLHTAYSSTCTHTDKGGQKHNTNYMQSQITFKSDLADNLVGTLDAYMIFPEYNYKSYDSKNEFVSSTHKVLYHKIVIDETTGALKFTEYVDYPSTDENDKFAHYTPVWLPDGEYKPVTHIGGLWTPIGECTAQVRQGDINTYLGIYSNKIIIDGSMYDDMYDNH